MPAERRKTRMIEINIHLIRQSSAEGWYAVSAPGYGIAVLYWGNEREALADFSSFAYVPIDSAGNGAFYFCGNRGIPSGVTHVWVKAYREGSSSCEWSSASIDEKFLSKDEKEPYAQSFSILTDLHMSQKPWRVRQALRMVKSDTVFLLGDCANDGLPEQFDRVTSNIEELIPDKTVFPVIGNHDVLHPSDKAEDGCVNYADFQRKMLSKAEHNGFSVQYAPDGRAYSVKIGDIDIVALACVTTGRKFVFPDERQIDWLEKHLLETVASWHIVLCHAPLIMHNPNRNDGPAYFNKNKRIQQIVDRTGRVIFLNGHTHVSPNVLGGNGEYDRERRNIYLDCASVVETDASKETGMMARDWKDGCATELIVSGDMVEIRMRSIASGIMFPRGYYRFTVPAGIGLRKRFSKWTMIVM